MKIRPKVAYVIEGKMSNQVILYGNDHKWYLN